MLGHFGKFQHSASAAQSSHLSPLPAPRSATPENRTPTRHRSFQQEKRNPNRISRGGATNSPPFATANPPMGSLLPGHKMPFSLVSPPPKPLLRSKALRFPVLQSPRSSSPSSSSSSSSSRVSAVAESSTMSSDGGQLVRKLRSTAGALVLTAAAVLYAGRFAVPTARAEHLSAPPATEETVTEGEERAWKEPAPSALSQFLESNAEAVETLRALLYEKLDGGEYAEGLRILDRLMAAQPSETEWKFLAARVHREMGEAGEARRLLEEILAGDPLSFEALFENAVLMDRCGEGVAAMERLERALEAAREGMKEKEVREVRLIMAQLQFLQKKVEEALSSYEELAREDPQDYRPYFCQGVIYSLLERNQEAREKFAKYRELSPRNFEVEGFLQTPLSRVKFFGTGDAAI